MPRDRNFFGHSVNKPDDGNNNFMSHFGGVGWG
jgi:hypothetical protein